MSTVNHALASVISQAAAVQQAKAVSAAPSSSNDNFGPAASVSLSTSAQSALAGTAATHAAPPPAVPVSAGASTSSDTQLLIEEAEQQVIPKVGVQGASEVVDSKGDINQVKLNELIAQQAQTARQAQISFSA